ncbi:replication initiation protein [Citreicella sp. C3M06]|uniref:plasmid replication protein RepC n=1 Tax=Citreicella sp. C3M06 TaxID=2841564 RepID=UPI001C08A2D5|nr:plasmid replication protein RepC [Citreicella sp. C3M06]MBU2960232.1 replication initiation protein [Citreicella sp. C3M06]
MTYQQLAPFGGGPVSLGQLVAARNAGRSASPAPAPVSKWDVLRDLGVARRAFGLSDRDLSVLQALLTFLPGDQLSGEGQIVFPSNARLSERSHGMAESTLRRHLAALVQAGVLLRRDSPNGKRYARRSGDGGISRAFGFDLAPLHRLSGRIASLAEQTRTESAERRALREDCVLLLRDCAALVLCLQAEGIQIDPVDEQLHLSRRTLRRKLDRSALEALRAELLALQESLLSTLPQDEPLESTAEAPLVTSEMSGSGSQNERHHKNSEKEDTESNPPVRLATIRHVCPELKSYSQTGLNNWEDVIGTSKTIAPMIGIGRAVWNEACTAMGPLNSAISVGYILQRLDKIKSPGGYMRQIARKARSEAFSLRPMVASLLTAVNSTPFPGTKALRPSLQN